MPRLPLSLAIAAWMIACGASQTPSAPVDVVVVTDGGFAPTATAAPDADAPVGSYTQNAVDFYATGESALAQHSYEEARTIFVEVKRRYSYSRYATLAELRVADIYFARGEYDQAARAYEQFFKDHRSNEDLRERAFQRRITARCLADGNRRCDDPTDAGF